MTKRDGRHDNEAVLIAFGSNMSSAPGFPVRQSASQAFGHLVKTLHERGLIVTKISRLWRSQAWPDPSDPPYVNAIIEVETSLQPAELMTLLHDVEREAGRVRTGVKNAPRVLDLDLIAYGRVVLNDEGGLVLPHPRAQERAFVMGPLAEILPGWIHPISQKTALNLYEKATIGRDSYPLDEAG